MAQSASYTSANFDPTNIDVYLEKNQSIF